MAKKAKVLGIFNNKGGILKSSLTSNLAASYALKGHKVLIVDMDSQANMSQIFGLNADVFDPNIYDTLVNDEHPKRAIINVYDEMRKKHEDRLEIPSVLKSVDMLPSNDDMMTFEIDVLLEEEYKTTYFNLLRKVIRQVESIYDYILIDSPPNMGICAGNILTAADRILIPFHPETLSKRSLMKTIKRVDKFKSLNRDLEILGIVGTKVKMNTRQHKKNLKETIEYAQTKEIHVFKNYIPETVKGADAVDEECVPAVLSSIKFSKEMKRLKAHYNDLFEEIYAMEGEIAHVK